MTIFCLDQPTEVLLSTFTARTERHGDEPVAALTLGLSLTGPNTILDKVSETLRQALYRVADDYTDQLDGIEPPTTMLRTKQLTGALPISVPEIKGGTLYVEWGIGEDMVFGGCTLKSWKAECFEGGTATLSFKVSTNDVDEGEAGHLFGKQGQTLTIRFAPPLPAPVVSTDGGAPLFDEPSDARKAAEEAFSGNPGAEGMDPNDMRAFPDSVDGDDDGQDAGDHVADDVEANGEGNSAKTVGQIRAGKRKVKA